MDKILVLPAKHVPFLLCRLINSQDNPVVCNTLLFWITHQQYDCLIPVTAGACVSMSQKKLLNKGLSVA